MSRCFLRNEFSGAMAQQICATAAEAGATEVRKMGQAGTSGKHMGNAPRDLLKTILKGSAAMPSLYRAPIPLLNKGTQDLEE